jgi:ABC-type transport system involved in multi-copper enzyme maturation permease subunit
MRNLLLRDLLLHRRVLLMACLLPVVMLGMVSLGSPEGSASVAPLVLLVGVLLLALLPSSLHIREGVLGTFGDLLALPVPRRDIVRLRFLEGFLICLVFVVLYLACWITLQHPSGRIVGDVFLSPFLLWVLCIFMAYPLPMVLKWGAKGAGLAYLLAVAGFAGWAFLSIFWLHRPSLAWLLRLSQSVEKAYDASGHLGAFGLPLALLAVFYGLSVWVLERVDA